MYVYIQECTIISNIASRKKKRKNHIIKTRGGNFTSLPLVIR